MITDIICFGVPVPLRDRVTQAFGRSSVQAQFPSLKVSAAELTARASLAETPVIALWHVVDVEAAPVLQTASLPVYLLTPGSQWDQNASGEALPRSFSLRVRAEGTDETEIGTPDTYLTPSEPAAAETPGPVRIAADGPVLLVPQPVGPKAKAGTTIEAGVIKLLHAARAQRIHRPVLLTNTTQDTESTLAQLVRCRSYLEDIIVAPAGIGELAKASQVITAAASVALECRARGIPVTFAGQPDFDERFPGPEAAAAMLQRINAFVMAPEDAAAEAPENGEAAEPAVAPSYRKAPPARIAAPKVPLNTRDVPDWYPPYQTGLPDGEFFGYVPWIPEHSDALISLIRPHVDLPVVPVSLVANVLDDRQRRAAMQYSVHAPEALRRLAFARLSALKGRIRGLIFTFDWHPFMMVISKVCQDLEIPRILVPHESVFAKRDMYYVDATTGVDHPSADLILAWGDLQKEIYTERRYPPERIEITGAPKFDRYRSGPASQLTRAQYCRAFSLSPEKPIVLFSAQPLDSQYNVQIARDAQRQVITDLLHICDAHGWQFILRTPPSRANDVVGEALRNAIDARSWAAIDQSGFYRVSPFDALSNCDALVSINSTMLFEALLLGKPAISTRYLEFDSFWEKTSVLFARNRAELDDALTRGIRGTEPPDLSWAERALSNGSFDGNAARRIGTALNEIATGARVVDSYCPEPRYVTDKTVRGGNIMLASLANLAKHHVYVPAMLNADNVGVPKLMKDVLSYDFYARWGLADTNSKRSIDLLASQSGTTPIYVEDGFIRSPGLGLSGDPGLSIILDDITPYYDATRSSRMQQILNSDLELSAEELARAEALIATIRKYKISKYNHAPVRDLSQLRRQNKAILLVDQRLGDQSIAYGRATSDTFMQMVVAAAERARDTDVFVKIHPDAITGGKQSCLGGPGSQLLSRMRNVHMLVEDVNPYSVLDVVDEVWVGTSGMGFEALMAGKTVRCFGVPFYAGRGVTIDEQAVPERTRNRSVTEMFHVAYLLLSRYYDPRKDQCCELEDLLDYLSEVSLGVELI